MPLPWNTTTLLRNTSCAQSSWTIPRAGACHLDFQHIWFFISRIGQTLEIVVPQSELLFNKDRRVKNAFEGWTNVNKPGTELDKILRRCRKTSRDFYAVTWWKVYSQEASFLDTFQPPQLQKCLNILQNISTRKGKLLVLQKGSMELAVPGLFGGETAIE